MLAWAASQRAPNTHMYGIIVLSKTLHMPDWFQLWKKAAVVGQGRHTCFSDSQEVEMSKTVTATNLLCFLCIPTLYITIAVGTHGAL